MKAIMSNVKYVAWKSPEELHETSVDWVSELKFIKDEQHFLRELIQDHTLELISDNLYPQSRTIINELSQLNRKIEPLLKKIINHINDLIILVDGVDQPAEEKQYKNIHSELMVEINNYGLEYKENKRKIFELIKQIIKQKNQKNLLR